MFGAIIGEAYSDYKALKAALEYEAAAVHRIHGCLHAKYPTDAVAETLTLSEKAIVYALNDSKLRRSVEESCVEGLAFIYAQTIKFFSGAMVFELLKASLEDEQTVSAYSAAGMDMMFLRRFLVGDPALAKYDSAEVGNLFSVPETDIIRRLILRVWGDFMYLYPDVVSKVREKFSSKSLPQGAFSVYCYKELIKDEAIRKKMIEASKSITFTRRAQKEFIEMISEYEYIG